MSATCEHKVSSFFFNQLTLEGRFQFALRATPRVPHELNHQVDVALVRSQVEVRLHHPLQETLESCEDDVPFIVGRYDDVVTFILTLKFPAAPNPPVSPLVSHDRPTLEGYPSHFHKTEPDQVRFLALEASIGSMLRALLRMLRAASSLAYSASTLMLMRMRLRLMLGLQELVLGFEALIVLGRQVLGLLLSQVLLQVLMQVLLLLLLCALALQTLGLEALLRPPDYLNVLDSSPTEEGNLRSPRPLIRRTSRLAIDQGLPATGLKSHLEAPLGSNHLFHSVDFRERRNLGHFGLVGFH